jgi:hypothetical protein
MQITVIGSRTFEDYRLLCLVLDEYQITRIISGGAKGADLMAERYAQGKGLPTLILNPEYGKFGKGAPFMRNHQIVDAAEQIVAFWDGESRGTAHSLAYARKKGKPVRIVTFPPTSFRSGL